MKFYAVLEIISVHILTQFLFTFIENKSFLPNSWENGMFESCMWHSGLRDVKDIFTFFCWKYVGCDF